MKKIGVLLFLLCLTTSITSVAQTTAMMYADTIRSGIPFAKDPHVIYFKHRFILYYSITGNKNKSGQQQQWGIGIAESFNLKNWKRVGEVQNDSLATYESRGICAPCALVIGEKVHLFYQTYGNGRKDAICHAWSYDGLSFTRDKTNPIFRPNGAWNCGRAIDAEVVRFKGKYLLFYATRDSAYKIQMLGVAVAPGNSDFNRSDWKNISVTEPMLKPELPWEKDCLEAPSVICKKGKLFLFYAGAYNNAPQQIGVAKSKDGIHWKRISNEPFLKNGSPGEWNSSESGHPHIFKNPVGSDYLFFQGNNTHGKNWYISNVVIGWLKGVPILLYSDKQQKNKL